MKKERKNHALHFRLSKEEMDELRMASYLDDVSVSEYVRRALRVYCNLLVHAPEVIEEYERSKD